MLKLEFLAVQMIEGMVFEGEEQTLLMDIQRDNRLGHHEEPVARDTRKLQQLSAKPIHSLE